ncbi:MAG: pentapeptide repeat-containing protein [Fluviicola sp.]
MDNEISKYSDFSSHFKDHWQSEPRVWSDWKTNFSMSFIEVKNTEFLNEQFSKNNLTRLNVKFEKVVFKDCIFQDIEFNRYSSTSNYEVLFDQVNFENVKFNNVKFFNINFNNSIFKNVEFSNVKVDKVVFNKVRLNNGCKGKINLYESSFIDCELFNEKLDYSFQSLCYFTKINLNNKLAKNLKLTNLQFDELTNVYAKKNKDLIVGLNGVYNLFNNTASINKVIVKGDSMLGGDTDVILNSLTKAKRAFTISSTVVLLSISLFLFGFSSFSILGLNFNPEIFKIIVFPISLISLYKCNVLLEDLSLNIKYVNNQNGAMKIGRFPWMLTRFWGNNKLKKCESFFVRFLYCFQTLLLLPSLINFFSVKEYNNLIFGLNISDEKCTYYLNQHIVFLVIIISLYLVIFILSVRIFIKSQKLQKPLVFDKTPTNTINFTEKQLFELNESLKSIKNEIVDFSNELKRKNLYGDSSFFNFISNRFSNKESNKD